MKTVYDLRLSEIALMLQKPGISLRQPLFDRNLCFPAQCLEPGDIQPLSRRAVRFTGIEHDFSAETSNFGHHLRQFLDGVIGAGADYTIKELAQMMAEVTGFRGEIVFDSGKPDGAPRKWLDVSRLKALGWEAQIPIKQGLAETYAWFLQHQSDFRKA